MPCRIKRMERGSALVTVLVFTAALLILGGALAAYSLNDVHIANWQERGSRLYYITEAGLEAGIAVMSRSMNHMTPLSGEIDGGSYYVEFVLPPGLPEEHPYYQQVPQRISAFQRIVVSTGCLGDRSLAMAAVVELDDVLTKALMVSKHLELWNCNIYGNVHANDQIQFKESIGIIDGYLTYGPETHIVWNIQLDTKLTLKDKDGTVTGEYTKSTGLPGAWQRSRIEVPPINFDLFRQEVQHVTEPSGKETWKTYPYAGLFTKIRVQSDLDIAPGNNETFNFDGLLVVDGNLNIAASKKAHVNISGVIVATGRISINGPVNAGILNPDDVMLLLVAKNTVSVDKSAVVEEQDLFLGGNLLFFSETGDVQIGSPSISENFAVHGSIVAGAKTQLTRVDLFFIPDIFEEVGDKLGLGVVVKEWIKPWTVQ